MKTLIVDDEKNARLALIGVLAEHFPEIDIVAECNNIPTAVKAIHKYAPDLVFLDISMPGYSGLELFKFFDDEITFKVIFVTAHSEYAINAFELSAVDYILKPIQLKNIDRALKKISAGNEVQNISLLKSNFNDELSKKIALKTGEGIVFVKFDDLIYLKADGSYTHFITDTHSKITVTKRIADFERLQNMGPFLRVHRSHIINFNRISKILKQDGGWVIMDNGDELSIASDRKNELFELFDSQKL